MADVNHIHLPSQAFMGGVYRHYPSIRAEARMQINPVFTIANVHAAPKPDTSLFAWSGLGAAFQLSKPR